MWRSRLKDGSWVGFIMLIVFGISFLIAAAVSTFRQRPAVLTMFLLVMGCIPIAAAFLAVYWRHRKYGDGPTTDEREQWIRLRGDRAGDLSFMIYWGVICIIPSFALRVQGNNTITIEHFWIPFIFVYGLVLRTAVRTIAIHYIRKQELTNDHK
jgi:hypothetical protein